MGAGSFRFERFSLDVDDRQLRLGGEPVEVNGRYFDALALLVRERGRLVSKDRFLEEVWSGVPVTDEALTQCIRTLRRQLGDDAARPRFIETVPKHGYRFIAPVEITGEEPATAPSLRPARAHSWRNVLLLGGAGTLGGGIAGLIGGLFYGFAGASQPGMGAFSILLVLLIVTFVIATLGAAGVAFGIAAAAFVRPGSWLWSIAGGALGGLLVGAFVKLIGLDAFSLFIGQSPGDITGAAEGACIGAAVGLDAWIANRLEPFATRRWAVAGSALIGGAVGSLIPLYGGRMMGGSLDLLARQFPYSRLRLDQIGLLFGEEGFGRISQSVMGGLEGALFAGFVVAAMAIARRRLDRRG
jgi:DNA-binding winged helix-turn-helix (wHTH) protein